MDLFKNDSSDVPADFGIDNIIVHPDYTRKSRYNDIALIKLNGSVEFTKKVRPACLWQDYSVNYTKALVTGYGHVIYKQGIIILHLSRLNIYILMKKIFYSCKLNK